MRTAIHITHEALQKVGGIGAVLQGLLTSTAYQKGIGRTLLVGPWLAPEEEARIAREGTVLYSTVSGVRGGRVGQALDRVAQKYDVNMVYGRRKMVDRETGVVAEPGVLLVDTRYLNHRLEDNFKRNLYERFGIQSDRYESNPDYSQYLRLAEPAWEAIRVLLGSAKGPHFVLAHEYMGVPTALKAALVRDPRFRTVFYAHEVATVRPIVEQAPGHDTMFYNAMERALDRGLSVSEVFGDQSGFYRHALVAQTHGFDGIFAVGDWVVREMQFLGREFQNRPIDRVYNGIPALGIPLEERLASRGRLQAYAEALLGVRPDVVFTHVTRPVVSKGLWRDLRVLEHLDGMLAAEGRKGVFFVLTTALGTRPPEVVRRLEAEYGWPAVHRYGAPDLVGPEAEFWRAAAGFNQEARAVRVVLVNQFGWDRETCGVRMPPDMGFLDLRKGTDVEFGQSIYEPFGIAQVEPLGFGALCVVNRICGCCGFVEQAAGGAAFPGLIVADYVSLPGRMDLEETQRIGIAERNRLEAARSREVAEAIRARLPRSDAEREEALDRGYRLAERMSWDRVCQDLFLPGLERAEGRFPPGG